MQQAIDILEKIRNKVILRWGPNDTDVTRLAELSLLSEIMKEFKSRGDGWIPVTERLPENSNDILLRGIFGYVNTAIGRYHHTGENGFVLPNTVGFYKTENVTHWMPLPNSIKQ